MSRGHSLGAGDRLPPLSHLRSADGRPPGWRRQGRDSIVAILLSGGRPEETGEYLNALEEARDEFRMWGGRLLVVVPPSVASGGGIASGQKAFPIFADEGNGIRRRLGLGADDSAVFVADRFGEIFHAESATSVDALPSPDIIRDWLKYLATQCAECGVPDEPGYGEWS